MKRFLVIVSSIIMFLLVVGCGSDKNNSATTSMPKKQEITMEQKKQATGEILRILGAMPQNKDEVEKKIWYQPWGNKAYPAKNAIYWYAGNKDDHVWMRAFIVNFSTDMGWVFWDKIIFSTTEKNWEYKIKNVFAGQSGGGKSTDIVRGGKYETLDIPIAEVIQGYKLLINGNNPIIRLEGKERYYDYKLTKTDIEHLKTGIYLYEQLQVTDGLIIK